MSLRESRVRIDALFAEVDAWLPAKLPEAPPVEQAPPSRRVNERHMRVVHGSGRAIMDRLDIVGHGEATIARLWEVDVNTPGLVNDPAVEGLERFCRSNRIRVELPDTFEDAKYTLHVGDLDIAGSEVSLYFRHYVRGLQAGVLSEMQDRAEKVGGYPHAIEADDMFYGRWLTLYAAQPGRLLAGDTWKTAPLPSYGRMYSGYPEPDTVSAEDIHIDALNSIRDAARAQRVA